MKASFSIAAVLCAVLLFSVPAFAQQEDRAAATPPPRTDLPLQARHSVFVMESVLEQAVQYGAQMLSDQLRTAGMPDMVLLTGAARARGFRLDGYGVFFDLEVPAVRQSVAWSLRMMNRPEPRASQALNALRGQLQMVTNPEVRANLTVLISQLEAEVGAPAGQTPPPQSEQARARVSAAVEPAASRAAVAPQLDDPGQVYTNEVRKAVIDAMFDHSSPMNLGAAEWLIVAARADMDRRFLSGDPNDVPTTMVLRVRGADLQAFREGRLTREEAAKRVEVTNF